MQDPTKNSAPQNAVALRGDASKNNAEDIIRAAKEKNIHIRQDAALAGALSNVEMGSNIPPELFRVVAEVISFVNRQNGKMR